MSLFEKKVPVFRKRDRETQIRISEILDSEGIWNRRSHFEQEEIPVGGYSAMDPRNYGRHGRIDREVYVVSVKASDEEKAKKAIHDAGIAAEVKTARELTAEAAEKIKNRMY